MATDPRLAENAYIELRDKLYRVVGRERIAGITTGRMQLENVRDLGTMTVSASDLVRSAELVKPAPPELPAHLDEQMDEHLSAVGLPPSRDRSL